MATVMIENHMSRCLLKFVKEVDFERLLSSEEGSKADEIRLQISNLEAEVFTIQKAVENTKTKIKDNLKKGLDTDPLENPHAKKVHNYFFPRKEETLDGINRNVNGPTSAL